MINSFSFVLGILRNTSCRRVAAILLAGGLLGVAGLYQDSIVSGFSGLKGKLALVQHSPGVLMTAPPVLSENKTLLLSYRASDDSGIQEIALRVTPKNSMPGANNVSVEIPLEVEAARRISRTDSLDLASHPWAGQKVTLQIVATNRGGKRSLTDPAEITLPPRRFSHPIARVLIEEREKLMQHPDDPALREEAANIMASIAHEPTTYGGDPVVLLALRSGAVRLVLGHDRESAILVNDLLWKTAARIEDGNLASTRHTLRDTTVRSAKGRALGSGGDETW
jgi:hypothetical protein